MDPHTFRRVADDASKAETALSGSAINHKVNKAKFYSKPQQFVSP